MPWKSAALSFEFRLVWKIGGIRVIRVIREERALRYIMPL